MALQRSERFSQLNPKVQEYIRYFSLGLDTSEPFRNASYDAQLEAIAVAVYGKHWKRNGRSTDELIAILEEAIALAD